MDTIQKFYTDIRKIVKHARSEENLYKAEIVCKEISRRFSNLFGYLGTLPESIAEYWMQSKILKSAHIESEPCEQNLLWLVTAADLLNGSYTDETEDIFTDADWKELCAFVNAEAEELPINELTDLMSIFMTKNVL